MQLEAMQTFHHKTIFSCISVPMIKMKRSYLCNFTLYTGKVVSFLMKLSQGFNEMLKVSKLFYGNLDWLFHAIYMSFKISLANTNVNVWQTINDLTWPLCRVTKSMQPIIFWSFIFYAFSLYIVCVYIAQASTNHKTIKFQFYLLIGVIL